MATHTQVSSKLLNKILLLKRSVHTVFQKVHGAQTAMEELQQDPHEMAQMFLRSVGVPNMSLHVPNMSLICPERSCSRILIR